MEDIYLSILLGGVLIVLIIGYKFLGSGYTDKNTSTPAQEIKKSPLVVGGPYSRYVSI